MQSIRAVPRGSSHALWLQDAHWQLPDSLILGTAMCWHLDKHNLDRHGGCSLHAWHTQHTDLILRIGNTWLFTSRLLFGNCANKWVFEALKSLHWIGVNGTNGEMDSAFDSWQEAVFDEVLQQMFWIEGQKYDWRFQIAMLEVVPCWNAAQFRIRLFANCWSFALTSFALEKPLMWLMNQSHSRDWILILGLFWNTYKHDVRKSF